MTTGFLEISKNRDGKAQHLIPGLFSKSFRADSGIRFDRGTVPVRQSPRLETLGELCQWTLTDTPKSTNVLDILCKTVENICNALTFPPISRCHLEMLVCQPTEETF